MRKENKHVIDNRLKVGDELFCYNGRDLHERVTVIEVDKKAKTARLSNQVVISRYPNTKSGLFKVMSSTQYQYIICRFDNDVAKKYKLIVARKRLSNHISTIQIGLLNRTNDIDKSSPEDLELILELESKLTNIFNKWKQ